MLRVVTENGRFASDRPRIEGVAEIDNRFVSLRRILGEGFLEQPVESARRVGPQCTQRGLSP